MLLASLHKRASSDRLLQPMHENLYRFRPEAKFYSFNGVGRVNGIMLALVSFSEGREYIKLITLCAFPRSAPGSSMRCKAAS